MRASGSVDSARALEFSSHLCWGFADRADFRLRAAEFIADGLANGQRIVYIGDSVEALSTELAAMDVGRAAVRSGRIDVRTITDVFRFGEAHDIVDAKASIQPLPAAVEAAIAEGYAGLRLITDGTSLATSPRQRAALSDLECLLDRMVAGHPLSAMCAFDLAVVGLSGLAEIACLHPTVQHGSTPFRVYAERRSGIAVAGSVDLACQDLFAASIDRWALRPEPTDQHVDLHLGGAAFLGHHSLMTLDTVAAARGIRLELHSARRIVQRMAEILDLRHVHIAESQFGTAA